MLQSNQWASLRMLLLCAPAVSTAASPPQPQPQSWTSSFLGRVEAVAVLQTLNADLLSHDSATLTLERWCGDHQLASPPKIVASQVQGVDKPPTPEQSRELDVAPNDVVRYRRGKRNLGAAVAFARPPNDVVRYRRVKLMCGALVLSEADNWYVPGRLTPEMNKLLDTTNTPFGVVVRALHFQRHTLSSTLLWLPLPAGWETSAAGARGAVADQPMPSKLLEHRAVLTLPDGTPFSEVVETYTDKV